MFDAHDIVAGLRLGDDLGGFFLAVERVGGDDAASQVHRLGARDLVGGRQFVTLVGRSDEGQRGALFVSDEADDAAQMVADGFAVQGQGGGQLAGSLWSQRVSASAKASRSKTKSKSRRTG